MIGSGLIPWRFRSRHNFVKANANFFLRQVARTPPVPCDPAANVEAHVLVCQRDLHMCLLAVKSFLHYAPAVAIVVHEDGTLAECGRALLRAHLPGARIISRDEAEQSLASVLPPDMAEARRRHVLLMKVFDFIHFNSGRRTILLDSDLVFRRPPVEALAWIAGDDTSVFYNPDPMRDTYRATVRPEAAVPDWFNSGFVGYRHSIQLSQATDAIRAIGYALEDQTVYAYLLAPYAHRPLDARKYFIYDGGDIPEQSCMVHFISPDRFTRMTYLKVAREVCGTLAE
ncbi:MAG: hypothetical protein H7337_08825 [Rhizobacter sp.]|nr:hypothetical protein [Rhizobacter sp.]